MQQCKWTLNGRTLSGKACNWFSLAVITESQTATFNLTLQKGNYMETYMEMFFKESNQTFNSTAVVKVFHISCKSDSLQHRKIGYM